MGQYWRQLQRQAWVPDALLAGRCWLKHPAQEGSAWLWRPAATSSAAQGHWQGSTRMMRTATPAKDLPSSQQQHRWEQAWQQVMDFQQQYGRLPRAKGDASCPLVPDERPLGRWCTDQQRRKVGSKDSPLTALQQAGLAAIPGWAWWARQGVQARWEQRLQQLEAFVRQQGRLPRRTAGNATPFLPGEQKLGNWVGTQHERHKGQAHPQLSTEQVAALEAVPGWTWGQFQQPWDERCQQVAEFVRKHGRLPRVGAGSTGKSSPLLPGEQQLGQWCIVQRQRRKGNPYYGPPLTVEQQAALEALPGWWWERRSAWEQQRRRLAAFVQQHGWLPREVPSKGNPLLPAERRLAIWCGNQRQRWKGNQPALTDEQQAALAAIPGWAWSVRDDRWEQRRKQLEAFLRQNGRLPRTPGSKGAPLVSGEKELGAWCNTQRQRWSGSLQPPLRAEQQAALAAIPGWAWDVRHDRWEQQREQLEAFVRQNGRLPRLRAASQEPLLEGERELASWCWNQRSRVKGYRGFAPLSAQQVAALEAIPCWNVYGAEVLA